MTIQPVITTAQISDALGENPGSFRAFKYVSGDQLPVAKIPGPNGRRIMAHPVVDVCVWLKRAMAPGKFGPAEEAKLFEVARENAK